MEREHKTKIVFNSKESGVISIEEEFRKEKNTTNIIKNISTSTGVSTFPSAKLEINATSKYPNLISLKTGDEVSIFVNEIDKPFVKLFQGVLLSVSIKTAKESFELVIESASGFYFLQDKKVNYKNFKNKTGLREIISELISICHINGQVEVDAGISNDFELTPFKNIPALALINSICYDMDLVYDFNSGDVMTISRRKDILNKMYSAIPIVIDNDKIISSEFKQ